MTRKRIAIVIASIITACCVVPVCIAMIYNATPAGRAALTATAAAIPTRTDTPEPSATLEPSPTPEPTEAPTPTNSPTFTPAPTRTPKPEAIEPTADLTAAPPASAAPGKSGIIAIVYEKTIRRGSNTVVSLVTSPGAACNIAFRLPSGRDSTAGGLGAATADIGGNCSWSWKIAANTTPGAARLTVTAGGQTQTYTVQITP